AVQAAHAAGDEQAAGGRREDPVRVGRADGEPADAVAAGEPGGRPGGAAVGGPEHAVAGERHAAAARVAFAGTGVERAARRDREGADRRGYRGRPGSAERLAG